MQKDRLNGLEDGAPRDLARPTAITMAAGVIDPVGKAACLRGTWARVTSSGPPAGG